MQRENFLIKCLQVLEVPYDISILNLNRSNAYSFIQSNYPSQYVDILQEAYEIEYQRRAYIFSIKQKDKDKMLFSYLQSVKQLNDAQDILSLYYSFNDLVFVRETMLNYQATTSSHDILYNSEKRFLYLIRPYFLDELGFFEEFLTGWGMLVEEFKESEQAILGWDFFEALKGTGLGLTHSSLQRETEFFLRNQVVYNATLVCHIHNF